MHFIIKVVSERIKKKNIESILPVKS